ncbi:hypothetical protein E3N88_09614 [Mikania micrantha]|uniref:Uncharacterized protein n=1 Tax=Mikania micrantha TaxID=192012 RepID=A0A5N6PKF2_9ASTR|nr:hypothetical protein E3N88_09614 [Mikania micrantha]
MKTKKEGRKKRGGYQPPEFSTTMSFPPPPVGKTHQTCFARNFSLPTQIRTHSEEQKKKVDVDDVNAFKNLENVGGKQALSMHF